MRACLVGSEGLGSREGISAWVFWEECCIEWVGGGAEGDGREESSEDAGSGEGRRELGTVRVAQCEMGIDWYRLRDAAVLGEGGVRCSPGSARPDLVLARLSSRPEKNSLAGLTTQLHQHLPPLPRA